MNETTGENDISFLYYYFFSVAYDSFKCIVLAAFC